MNEDAADFGAFVHVDDVADAVVKSMTAPAGGHVRVTLCGPGLFDCSAARRELGWEPTRGWGR
jgi:nucleoside-diphosphate-sugar epimerase